MSTSNRQSPCSLHRNPCLLHTPFCTSHRHCHRYSRTYSCLQSHISCRSSLSLPTQARQTLCLQLMLWQAHSRLCSLLLLPPVVSSLLGQFLDAVGKQASGERVEAEDVPPPLVQAIIAWPPSRAPAQHTSTQAAMQDAMQEAMQEAMQAPMVATSVLIMALRFRSQ